MQLINQPGLSVFNQVFSVSAAPIIVPLATNVRGVRIVAVAYNWFLGAINSQLALNITSVSSNEFYAGMIDDNGATGPINISKNQVFERDVQFSGGQNIALNVSITGTARVGVYVVMKVL